MDHGLILKMWGRKSAAKYDRYVITDLTVSQVHHHRTRSSAARDTAHPILSTRRSPETHAGHVSPIMGAFGQSAIRADGKIEKIAQNPATSCAFSGVAKRRISPSQRAMFSKPPPSASRPPHRAAISIRRASTCGSGDFLLGGRRLGRLRGGRIYCASVRTV